MCLLTNYSIANTIPDKTTMTFIQAYLKHIYATFDGSLTLITNKEKDFKNKPFLKVASKIEIKHQFSSPHCNPITF